MSRLSNIPKNLEFLKALKLSTHEFKQEHNVTDLYFANKLHFKSKNAQIQYNKLLQPFNDKYIKVDELLLLLESLGSHNKIILDFLCDRFGYVCSTKAKDETIIEIESIKDQLLKIGGSNGTLFSNFINYNSDNKLDIDEIDDLLNISYRTRAMINQFEHDLKRMKRDL